MMIRDIIKRYFEAEAAEAILCEGIDGLNEIRIRADKPVILRYGRREKVLRLRLGCGEISDTLSKMSEYSAFAFREEIRNGFITLKGGFRVGVCGRAVVEGDRLRTITDCTSLNIRIPENVVGCARELMRLYDKGFRSTVIISPPGCGKTTILRDTVRSLSERGYTLGVCDERGELDCFRDLGIRTDVMEGCPKSKAVEILVRGLSPDIIAVDELGGREDRDAIRRASYMGVGVIATLHGDRPDNELGELFECKVILEGKKGEGRIKKIYA